MASPIRVLIVDDHPVVHDGVAAVLNRTPDIRVVASVQTLAEAATSLGDAKPDIVLLDVRLREADGLAGIGTLLDTKPGLRVVMFSAYDVDEFIFGALRAGARGYLLQGAPGSELITAIRTVHAGESYLSPSISAKLVDRMQARSSRSRL